MAKSPFIPPRLPPKIDYASLIQEIGQAHSTLGRLNGLLVSIPNPDLLTTPLLTKEAVLSSRIEGTQATLGDVFEYEAGERTSEESEKEKDIKEIINYRRAMHIAIEQLEKKPIREALIKKLHFCLLDSVRGTSKDRGSFRRREVYIGLPGSSLDEATYVPPTVAKLPSLLSNWEQYVNSGKEKDPLVQAGVAHYQFEAIHPFMDGNGRIGRLLIPLFLYRRKLLSYPLLYISEYFEERRREYYDLLSDVSERGDWESWLRFFLSALSTQSIKTQAAVLKILALYESLKGKITTVNSIYAIFLLDIIFTAPVVSFVSIKKRLKTKSHQTIYNLLAKFIKLGILREISGRRRNRTFVFEQLLRILK